MREWCLVVVVMVTACGGGDDYPPRPGDPPTGDDGPDTSDAAIDGASGPDASSAVAGHVCVISDLRRWNVCATSGVAGLAVTIGTVNALTDSAGNFTIEPPATAPTDARITGTLVVPSYYPYDATADTIELIAANAAAFADVVAQTPMTIADGDGSLLLELRRDNNRTAGMTAEANPPTTAYYDNAADKDVWLDTVTGLDSKTLIPDLPTGPASITAAIGADMGSATYDVHGGSITFGTLNVIP